MNVRKISILGLLFILSAAQSTVYASAPGDGLCTLSGAPVLFQRVKDYENQAIVRATARVDETASLEYIYSPFYDGGGSVELWANTMRIILLRWDSPHAPSVTHGKMIYRGLDIECRIGPRSPGAPL